MRPHPSTRDLAAFAETILTVGRKILVQELDEPGLIHLSNSERLVISHIDMHPGISPTRLGRELGLQHTSNTSAALRVLEEKGLVIRRSDPDDRRRVRLEPTPLARQNLEHVRAAWAKLLAPHLRDLDQLRPALDLLTRLDTALSTEAD